MWARTIVVAFLPMFLFTRSNSMIMRNNALMTKMVSQFQGKESRPNENSSMEPQPGKENVVSMMQNVLCRNFPSIPCDLIVKDATLRHLIEKSIQQTKYKKLTMDKTTLPPNYQLTLFPVMNSEDLSNVLPVSDPAFHKQKHKSKNKQRKKTKKSVTSKNFWSHEAPLKKKSKTAVFNGRKKIRKFYPHKIKYKDKNVKQDFGDYSEEKLSMSVEVPEPHTGTKKRHFSYRSEPDPPVWRIDYLKHGEPSLNMFDYESDALKGKIIKTGPNVVVDENVMEQAARRDVLHPDVYIKNNYVRKRPVDHSEPVD